MWKKLLVSAVMIFGVSSWSLADSNSLPTLSVQNTPQPTPEEIHQYDQDIENLSRAKQLSEIISQMQRLYVDESKVADVDHLYDIMMERLLKEIGEEHGDYYDEENFQDMNAINQYGAVPFFGIGAQMTIDPFTQKLTIVDVIPGSPAEKAGFKNGDKVLRIDDVTVVDVTPDNMTSYIEKIKGAKGTKVKLTIDRAGSRMDITSSRDEVVKSNVRVTNFDNIAIIRLDSFMGDVSEDMRSQLNELFAKAPRAVILDLRHNPGGLLDQGIKVASMFEKAGVTIVTVKQRDHEDGAQVYETKKTSPLATTPMIVLIDKGSASASEVVAGALQSNGRAMLMGEHSYGKGSVQNIRPLSSTGGKTGVKFTTAHYYVGNNQTKIDKIGLEPDFPVAQETPEPGSKYESDLVHNPLLFDWMEGYYLNSFFITPDVVNDNVMKEAVNFLNANYGTSDQQ